MIVVPEVRQLLQAKQIGCVDATAGLLSDIKLPECGCIKAAHPSTHQKAFDPFAFPKTTMY